MKVHTKLFNNAIKNAVIAINKTKISNMLVDKIHLKVEYDYLLVEATDGFRFHQSKVPIEDTPITNFDCLLTKVEPVKTKENFIQIEVTEDKKIKINNTLYDDYSNKVTYLNSKNVIPEDKSDYQVISINPNYLIDALKNTKADENKEVLLYVNKTSDIAPILIINNYNDILNIVLPKRRKN